jgi:hypothetical protein
MVQWEASRAPTRLVSSPGLTLITGGLTSVWPAWAGPLGAALAYLLIDG